mgnify:CR=1 FL=1
MPEKKKIKVKRKKRKLKVKRIIIWEIWGQEKYLTSGYEKEDIFIMFGNIYIMENYILDGKSYDKI